MTASCGPLGPPAPSSDWSSSSLGAAGQSLCVPHLPQVAAQAAHHLHVAKQVRNGHTSTRITYLDADTRVEEIARMLGGVELTAQTRAHAADMIERARD